MSAAGQAQPPRSSAHAVWGSRASVVFTLLVWLAFNGFALALARLFIVNGWLRADVDPGVLQHSGLFLATSTLVNAVLCSALVVGLVRLRRGRPVREYLALRAVAPRAVGMWLGVLLLFLLTSEGIGYWLQRPVAPDFLLQTYRSAVFPLLLWLALIVAAPLFEELLFRGFLQTGLQATAGNSGWAIVLPALLWAVIHWQYDLYDMSWIFLFGVLLGLARWHTGSLWAPVLMHMCVNLIALIATVSLVD